jgi:hypothetical protein
MGPFLLGRLARVARLSLTGILGFAALILAVVAPMHVFGAFVEGGWRARVAVTAITACLMALWVVALPRGRAHEHTIMRRWL